jgi:RNA polymerase sigma-70 factor (ECF subfamily)
VWAPVFERYRALALRLAASLSLGAADAEEAVQEAAVEILGRAARDTLTLDSEEACRNYFLRAVRNRAINRRARARPVEPMPVETASSSEPPPIERLVAREERMAQATRVESVRRALAALPAAERELIEERFFRQKTLREIHEATGVAISTLHDREGSALESIRAGLVRGTGA